MHKIIAWLAVLCAALPLCAQGVRYDSQITTVQTNYPFGAQAPILAVPYAKVFVCSTPVTQAPCVQTRVYSDQGLTLPLAQPLTVDAQGRYGFWAAPGNYAITAVAGSLQIPAKTVTLGGSGNGGASTWGTIYGSITSQADLASALAGKQSTLTSPSQIISLFPNCTGFLYSDGSCKPNAVNFGTTVGTAAAGNDARITGALQTSGGVMSGPFTLNGDPTSALQAATKQYVDTHAGAVTYGTTAGTAAQGNDARIVNALPTSGGSLSGPLVLAANPTTALQAAPKQYVDAAVASAGGGVAPTSNGVQTYSTANKSYTAATPSDILSVLNQDTATTVIPARFNTAATAPNTGQALAGMSGNNYGLLNSDNTIAASSSGEAWPATLTNAETAGGYSKTFPLQYTYTNQPFCSATDTASAQVVQVSVSAGNSSTTWNAYVYDPSGSSVIVNCQRMTRAAQ